MTKKSLSDLLREEANTTSETGDETSQNPEVPTNRTRMTKAQLDDLVTELNQALELEKKQVNTLQSQLKTLENQVKEERNLSKKLQTQLQEAEEYQTQLAEQKKLVEKLYTQLQQKEELVIELAEKNDLIASLQAKVTQETKPIVSSSSCQKLVVQETALTRQARELEPFAAPASATKPLTNEDIGWFD